MPYPVAASRGKNFGSPAPAVLILDEFTDPNGTAITAHTIAPTNIPATSWTNLGGAWTIQDNAARPPSDSTVICESGKANVTISAKFTALNWAGIALRVSAALTGWFIRPADTDNKLTIYEGDGVSFYTKRAEQTLDITDGITVTVAANGSTITVTSDQGHSLSYASATRNQTVTTHGLHGMSDTERIDNFKVTT